MLKQINIKVIITSCAIAFITVLVHMFVKSFTFDLLDALIGVAGGMLLTVLRFSMLKRSIDKQLETDGTLAKSMGFTGYMGRYILTAAILIVAVLYKIDTFVAMAVTLVVATNVAARLSVPRDDKKGGSEGDR